MDSAYEHPTGTTGLGRNSNAKIFTFVSATAAVVVALVLFLTIHKGGHRSAPDPAGTSQTATFNQAAPLIAKPSPLHPAALQAAVKPAKIR